MIRFTDRKDVKSLIKQSKDFHKRNYVSLIKWLSYTILAASFAIALNVNRTLYDVYSGVDMVLASDVVLTITFMAILASVIVCYLLIIIRNMRNRLDSLEFQSALLSGAARHNTNFLMILAPNGDILYADRHAMSIFSDDHLHDIDDFLETSVPSEDDKGAIYNAIGANRTEDIKVEYKDKNDRPTKATVTVAPLDKPIGYFLIKS